MADENKALVNAIPEHSKIENTDRFLGSGVSEEFLVNLDNLASAVFEKIKSEFGAAAFLKVANNDTTTAEGYVADARAVNALGEEVDELNSSLGVFSYWDNVVSPDSGSITLTMSRGMRSNHMYLILIRRLNGEEDTYPPYAYLLYMRPRNYARTTIGEESEVVDRKISDGKLTLTFKNIQWTRMTVYEVM